MRIRSAALALAAVAVALTLVATAQAGKFNKVVNVGDKGADWSNLKGVDGKTYASGDFKDKKALVLVFTCNHCPVAVANEDRLIELQKEYADKGVQVLAISVSDSPDDSLEKMKERSTEKKFNFPYLYDASQKIAKDYGAAVTPHVFLLDGNRKVAYMGLIDDNTMEPAKVKTHHLRDAIDAVLAGKSPATNETRPSGCGIQYR
jgi:peroxiredoxin